MTDILECFRIIMQAKRNLAHGLGLTERAVTYQDAIDELSSLQEMLTEVTAGEPASAEVRAH